MTTTAILAVAIIPILLAAYVQLVMRLWLRFGEPIDYWLMRSLRAIAQASDRLDREEEEWAARRAAARQ